MKRVVLAAAVVASVFLAVPGPAQAYPEFSSQCEAEPSGGRTEVTTPPPVIVHVGYGGQFHITATVFTFEVGTTSVTVECQLSKNFAYPPISTDAQTVPGPVGVYERYFSMTVPPAGNTYTLCTVYTLHPSGITGTNGCRLAWVW